jgi:hypothetical protein
LDRGRPRFPPDCTCPAVLTHHPRGPALSPTGLSPAPAARSSGVRLGPGLLTRRPLLPGDQGDRPTPAAHRPAGHPAPRVWAAPVSLAATAGILSAPRGTQMFHFPRFPPAGLYIQPGVTALRRPDCSIRAPSARRVATAPRGVSPPARAPRRPPPPRHPPRASLPYSPHPRAVPTDTRHEPITASFSINESVAARTPNTHFLLHLASQQVHRLSRCRGLCGWSHGGSNPEPPPCKGGALPVELWPPGARRADCPARGGRAWTRTRGLGLIRAAL